MARCIVPVLLVLTATASFVSLHPRTRPILAHLAARLRAGDPDERYRLAERYFQAADFEKAEIECEQALRRNPTHHPTHALLLELRFIKGRPGPYPTWIPDYRGFNDPVQIALADVEAALGRGDQLLETGDPEGATREFRRILEYAKWLPIGVEVETRRKQAREGLARIADLRSGGD